MAKRIATEYVKACLQLSDAEMLTMLDQFSEHEIHPMVKIVEGGSQELSFQDEVTGEDVKITFERRSGTFVLNGGFRITNLKVADFLRKTIIRSKGDALVHRIYTNFTVAYHYVAGSVVRIVELSPQGTRLIFEYKDAISKLEESYLKKEIEHTISQLRYDVDFLLDQRNAIKDVSLHKHIDAKLTKLAQQLFILEA